MPKGIDKKWSEEETVIQIVYSRIKYVLILFVNVLEKICKRIKAIWKKFP